MTVHTNTCTFAIMITAKHLKFHGYEQGPIMGLALRIAKAHFVEQPLQESLAEFKAVLRAPDSYTGHAVFGALAEAIILANQAIGQKEAERQEIVDLKAEPLAYVIYGKDHIEEGALQQMNTAMRLPVAVAGALMPDAHQGYGLPIGGVLAARNAVIPYGVGVDIGCRMALTIFDIPANHLLTHTSMYQRELIAHTAFGAGSSLKGKERASHQVLEDKTFQMNKLLRDLQDKAAIQLGSSGSGNHFVEWGVIDFGRDDQLLNVPEGRYLALLTHSGSRGLGASIAGHYTKLAKQICKLEGDAAHLAYLDMDSEEGREYWLAMNLAGDYASACHEVIHQKMTKAIGGTVLATIENHHNFAWKEQLNGEEVIVHRKGATPAGKGVMGIIPGSMTAPGFLVRGKGVAQSINSASHGAGRQMSRSKAFKTVKKNDFQAYLREKGVILIGGGLDEAPAAYKDIHQVMAAQEDLVDVVAKFTPKIVRMDGE
jgi:tRNA-splicing ligase RtcB (3'-phosphate/5'-hydroxy nucleic acid ligase)